MKKLYSLALAALMSVSMLAVETEYLPISVYAIDNLENFPAGAKAMIENKLTQLLTKNGIAGINTNGQFILTITTTPLDKDVIPGPPSKIAEKMEMNLYIVDAYAKNILSSTSITVRGLGETENKCYMDAISHMPLNTQQMSTFIAEGKEKIIAYYDHEGEAILGNAKNLAKQKKFDEALYMVSLIPQQCKHYKSAMTIGLDIYQQQINHACTVNLNEARMAWVAEQNALGAYAAGQYLANILPDAACYGEAMALYKEIKAKVLDDWKFEMKQHQDTIDLEKQRIDASRQIGVAYGNNQPKEKTTIEFLHTLQ